MLEDETLRTLANAEIFKGLTHDEVKIFYPTFRSSHSYLSHF